MNPQNHTNYQRIEKAIHYIYENRLQQPSLSTIAEHMKLSRWHFQRLFTHWAGISPKKYMQYLTLEHAKRMLQGDGMTTLDTAWEAGLSGTGRLHDLFVSIEGMTPGEFRNGGEKLTINYSFAASPFGKIIVASTTKGICHLFFVDEEEQALGDLRARFPNASYHQITDKFQQDVLFLFQKDWRKLDKIKLHLSATPFQLKVWESLLKIPMGRLTSYGEIAREIGAPKAARAVGSAVGANPVAYLIPCHRVIRNNGHIGEYMWGAARKSAMIGWESARMCDMEAE